MPFDFKKEYKEFYMPKNKPEIVNVPKANYLSDARKVLPEKWKTVIRHPIRKKKTIETKRLRIYPASEKQMKAFIASQAVDILKAAYSEMLDGALTHPEQWEWYAIWMIELKDGTHAGELCFKGVDESGSTEIGYGIDEKYQNCGYATEAVCAVADWALEQNAVNCVTAEVDKDNIASVRVLEKSGFELTGRTGEEGPIYRKMK